MVAATSPIFHSNPIAYQDGKDNPAYRFRESKQWPSIKKCRTTIKRLIENCLGVWPEEAETVRLIFRRYLKLGSLVEDLDRKGVRTKRRLGTNGRSIGGIRFGVGPLAHLLIPPP
jgi:hypothetical protein